MKKIIYVLVLAAGFISAAGCHYVYGAGLMSYEQGQPGVGEACVGSAASADDASTVYFNPAGMSRLERSELLMGGHLLLYTCEFTSKPPTNFSGSDGGDNTLPIPGGGFYYVQKQDFLPNVTFGLSMNAPAGLGLKYDDDWKGRYLITESFLAILDIDPAVSVRLTDWLSVGGGVDIYYGYMHQKSALFNLLQSDGKVDMKFSDWGVGGNAGILFEPWETTRLGVIYRSKVDLDLSGDIDFENAGPLWQLAGLRDVYAHTKLALPNTIMASLYQVITDRLALVADGGWQQWSCMKTTSVTTETGAALTLQNNWKDTWHAGVGAEYRITDPLLLRAGVCYDSNPSPEEYRLPNLPVDDTWQFAAGLEYDVNKDIALSLNYVFMIFGDAPISFEKHKKIITKEFVGNYDQFVNLVGFSFRWKFGK